MNNFLFLLMQAPVIEWYISTLDIFNLKWEVDFDRLISNVYR